MACSRGAMSALTVDIYLFLPICCRSNLLLCFKAAAGMSGCSLFCPQCCARKSGHRICTVIRTDTRAFNE